jgi:uncharacterized protein YfaP (DUF2135 family)
MVPRSSARGLGIAAALLAAGCDDASINVIDGTGIFSPSSIDFGIRELNVTHEEATILALPPGNETLQVIDVTFDPPSDAFAARLADAAGGGVLRGAVVVRGNPLPLKILFAPREAGSYDGSMTVVFQNNNGVQLPIKATGASGGDRGLVFRPAEVQFTATELERDRFATVLIENAKNRAVTLREVRMLNSGLVAGRDATPLFVTEKGSSSLLSRPMVPAGGSIEVDVHFKPSVTGTVSDGLLFIIEPSGSATLPVTGIGVPAGVLRCEPREIDFGPMVRGTVTDRSVVCTAEGGSYTLADADLSFATASLFTIANRPLSGVALGPGQSINVGVRFESRGLPLRHSGDLVLTSELGQATLVRLLGQVEPPPIADRDLSITADWDVAGTDLDLHLVRSGAMLFDLTNDCFYRNKFPDWGQPGNYDDNPHLDRDDTDAGPEEINLTLAREPSYEVYLHYYRGATVPSGQVTVRFDGVVAASPTMTLNRCGDLWHVGTVIFDAGGPRFTAAGAVTDARLLASCN